MIHDPQTWDPSRSDLLVLQPEILAGAVKLSGDPTEANELAHLTFIKAMETPRDQMAPGRDTRLWLFGVMRGVFHSVERQRQVRRERGFTVATQRAAQAGQAE
jgi:DNA-directed RNA polymerase specialized sigma24 family protein